MNRVYKLNIKKTIIFMIISYTLILSIYLELIVSIHYNYFRNKDVFNYIFSMLIYVAVPLLVSVVLVIKKHIPLSKYNISINENTIDIMSGQEVKKQIVLKDITSVNYFKIPIINNKVFTCNIDHRLVFMMDSCFDDQLIAIKDIIDKCRNNNFIMIDEKTIKKIEQEKNV